MSRLTDLIARVRATDVQLGDDLQREFRALSNRREFGLNFERHQPEAVELANRPIRRGDKVLVLPERGATGSGNKSLWLVTRLLTVDGKNVAELKAVDREDESVVAPVADLAVIAEFRDVIYPGLVSDGKVKRGGDKPFHTVINGENYHALKALTYTANLRSRSFRGLSVMWITHAQRFA